MRIVPVPCLSDNYAYLVIDGARAAVVDPGEAPPIEAALAREHVELAAIWLTHHHHDHVGGVRELVASRAGRAIEVVAHVSDRERAPGVTRLVDEGDRVTLPGTTVTARIIHNPGHTLGAISYVTEDAVFTGDTLFAAGCGRLFEGDPAMMFSSLAKLAALPPATRVYFGHEYTRKNLEFAVTVEPDNTASAAKLRGLGEPPVTSTPSTIADELATNVFVRSRDAAELGDRRARKDTFR